MTPSFMTYLSNKCKQYAHRIFYILMNNTSILHFTTFIGSLSSLDQFITKTLNGKLPFIVLISNNILFKTIVFTYCFMTGNKLVMISPKFPISEVLSTILSRRGVNLLLVDREILLKIKDAEKEEGINILQFFTHVETTLKMLEILLEAKDTASDNDGKVLRYLTQKSRARKILTTPLVSILSPGTTSVPSITNVPYDTFGKSTLDLSYFMGLKPGDKVSVIANFELFPTIYTILGLLNGTSYVQLEKDDEISSHTELKELLNRSNHKPNVFFISTNNFRNVWDSILSDVYSKKCIYFLSKFSLVSPIVNYFIRKELRNTFGKQTTKIHILNEELGFSIWNVLKCSKIMFSASYGFLEQGNFLAFKDPSMFRNKDFMLKPGGSILKDTKVDIHNLIFEGMKQEMKIGDIYIPENETTTAIRSGDIGFFVPNTPEQGDRKYLYIYDKNFRNDAKVLRSLDLLERTMKDTFLIRDCFIRRVGDNYEVFIEPREELIDTVGMSWEEYHTAIKKYLEKFKDNTNLHITRFAILKFKGMRNVAGKLQYYAM